MSDGDAYDEFGGDALLMRDEIERLRAVIARYEHCINWGVTCEVCANQLDASYREYERADRAESLVREIRELRSCLGAGPMDYEAFVDELDVILRAAVAGPGPTPEPAAACDVDKFDGHSLDALCPCGHSWREHRGQGYGPCLVCIVSRGPGPTDDERPARETVNDCLDTWEAMDAAELRTDDERPATGETQR